jgi:predicted glycoside hydrolase/deacetylase ChbG (UPF0249 family)
MKNRFIFTCCILIAPFICNAQSIAERLGYSPDTRLLILHADDLGVSHSVNKASFEALASGAINSASIMVPCPWLLEVADAAKANPEFDLGLHLTLTAEWENFKWDGVTTTPESSLLNDHGYFYDNTADVNTHADPDEVRKELQGQIDMAVRVGITPTHLDSHMGALFTPKLFPVYVQVGRENKMPVFVPTQAQMLFSEAFPKPEDVVLVNYLGSMSTGVDEADWVKHYSDLLRQTTPGINEIIIHLGYDDEELQAVTVNHPDFGAKWRELDFEVVNNADFQQLIEELDIKFVTYREIQQVLYGSDN